MPVRPLEAFVQVRGYDAPLSGPEERPNATERVPISKARDGVSERNAQL